MAVIVNTPTQAHDDRSNLLGTILGLILLAVLAYLFIVYGLPALRGGTQAPQLNVPSQIDVNVNPGSGGQAQ